MKEIYVVVSTFDFMWCASDMNIPYCHTGAPGGSRLEADRKRGHFRHVSQISKNYFSSISSNHEKLKTSSDELSWDTTYSEITAVLGKDLRQSRGPLWEFSVMHRFSWDQTALVVHGMSWAIWSDYRIWLGAAQPSFILMNRSWLIRENHIR